MVAIDAAALELFVLRPRGSIGRCMAFSEGGRRWDFGWILLLVFDSWRRCVRVEVSNPPPAARGCIRGAFLALRSDGLDAKAAQAELDCFTAKAQV